VPKKGSARPQTQNPAAVTLQAKLRQGLALHQQGNLADAERIYGEVLRQQSNHFDALHLLGVIALQTRRTERAVELITKAIGLDAKVATAHSNLGSALHDLKRPAEALASYDKAIALKPDYAEAHYNRGNALSGLKRSEDALATYDRAIALKPDYAEAHSNRSVTLQDLKRPADALASCDRAIALKPDYAEAYYNRGNALSDLKRPEEALASWDKAIALKPDYTEAYYIRGIALQYLNRPENALASYDRAICLRRDYAEAYYNRGNALSDLKRPEEALASWDKAIALKPDYAEAYYNRGSAFARLRRHDKAFAAYDKALALNSDLIGAESARLHSKMHICDWSNFDADCAHLISSVRNENVNIPFQLLAIPSSSGDQLQCAKRWIANKYPPSEKSIWQGNRYDHSRIRIAYLSADFYQHATSYLMAGMFECHDNSRFDVTAISIEADDNSELRQRLKAAFEHFIDARNYTDVQIADLVRGLEIDILIDLKGFTADSRTGILARRSAPIQVNYLGYPGTMGAPYIDYIVADQIVIPKTQWGFYSEKVVFLPNSYQVNDTKRSIADKALTRAELALPPTGFVFCCFNNNYKITPRIFDCWMRILKQVEGSVLWLLEDNANAASNLRKEAAARDVSTERLIFAKRMPLPEHLARHRLADLFLDTLPCNAHTSASDALWAGLPVLTSLGETFAGKVAASLLNAIRLPELITTTLEAYERMAIDLVMHPERLAIIKRKLAENRLTTPLFDTKLFTRHIEAAYRTMYERHQAGLAPDHIDVPDA
jgi:predicted O-linked N-acetylglucosamine transferase (SPINDLY family)